MLVSYIFYVIIRSLQQKEYILCPKVQLWEIGKYNKNTKFKKIHIDESYLSVESTIAT